QEFVNESLRQVKEQNDDLFNPADDLDSEKYGTNYRRFNKRVVPSDRIPIASADLERYKKLNSGFKRPRYNADNASSNLSLRSYDVNSEDNSRCNSREGSFRKRKRNRNRKNNEKNDNTGSKDSVASSNKSSESMNTVGTTKSRNEGLPIPVSLLKDGFDFDKFQETVLDESLEPEVFGQQLADALGEINSELICFAVKTIGVMAANRIFKKTKGVEKQGGMHVDNKTRRRTPGGVFIKLLRSDKLIPENLRDKVRNYGAQFFSKSNASKKQQNNAMQVEDAEIPSAADVFILNSETKSDSK
uniref:Phosphorylated adapter RNA export protein n=1 Tax=Panagrolaimus sp. JU765 TaxID=591449 RepID=A0AC34Q2K0_9BILA